MFEETYFKQERFVLVAWSQRFKFLVVWSCLWVFVWRHSIQAEGWQWRESREGRVGSKERLVR